MATKNTSTQTSVSRTSYNRPKLLRSCATAPTLVTSYASRNDRSSPNFASNGLHASSKDKATTLLSRVASYSYGCSEKSEERRKQVANADKRIVSSPGSRRDIGEKDGNGKSKKKTISLLVQSDGGKNDSYFSFPSFEEFEEYREECDGGDKSGRKSR